MGRLIVEQIVSVDGYAADLDGGIGFFEAVDEVDSNDADQLAFLEWVDAIRMFAGYWPYADPQVERVAEPINRLPKFVVSNTLTDAPWGDGEVEVLRGDGAEAAAALKERYGAIIVWGSLTLADALLEAGIVDELRLRVVPVLIGEGRSFTPAKLGERRLALDHVVAHPSGHVGMNYRTR
ncbi:dihydrofolate reductase family protein [Diaminobutyricimonas sp. LJ205]|uniref:dihydrofolate reductase family protein n=1 Tax=Diaminobutyricimonas sp. LJ205 TaxID=2683590 RepID=UPI0012F4DA29|nr:dihydrofolate reductase family protein [Diaminobutyricimonas sp. LJ205]